MVPSNFQPFEDEALSTAYIKASLQPAIGTDQSSDMFWNNVHFEFIETLRLDLPALEAMEKRLHKVGRERTIASLTNRWNKIIRKSCLKFTAMMTKASREDHSGWNMEKYVALTKRFYTDDTRTEFKFERCFDLLKRTPKFEIDLSSTSTQVLLALNLDERPLQSAESGCAGVRVRHPHPPVGLRKQHDERNDRISERSAPIDSNLTK